MKTEKITLFASWYVGFWLVVSSTLGALALVRWALQALGWLP